MDLVRSIVSKREGTWYFSGDGYYYWKNRPKGNTLYLDCIRKNHGCHATGRTSLLMNGPLIHSYNTGGTQHNHEPNEKLHQVQTFQRTLLQRSENERTTPLKRIFYDECSHIDTDTISYAPYTKVFKGMQGTRAKTFPPCPDDLIELAALLQFDDDLGKTIEGNNFYLDILEDKVLLLLSPDTKDLLNNEEAILTMDGTFKSTPKKPKIFQLFTIGAIYRQSFFIIAFALMTNKAAESYTWIFERLQQEVPLWNPTHMISDFETGSYAAFHALFHNARSQGCWFHYSQAIEKRVKSQGLAILTRENVDVRTVIKMIMALPLLNPEEILAGFDTIRWHVQDVMQMHFPALTELINYVENYWINTITPERISVANSSSRTNNAQEAFHNQILMYTEGPHPNATVFIDALRKMQHVHAAHFKYVHRTGNPVVFPVARKWRQHHQRIQNSIATYQENGDLYAHLRRLAHSADFHLMEHLMAQMANDEENVDGDLQELIVIIGPAPELENENNQDE
ncbi:uncharacterized protein LOC135835915 [Planococcus citri]|uniref:uncharacterized protein LOC135835915 n=1 Tax=Planococcus citri TaxID=170843 RepID=UPI0031F86FF9